MTKITGILGHPVAHSKSPELHNGWYQKQNLDFDYQSFDVPSTKLAQFFSELPNNLRGLSITVPHKENVRQFLSTESEAVQTIGACNTIIRNLETGSLHGENTDWQGWLAAIKQQSSINLSTATILVIGAGGAAKAILYALKQADASSVSITNRTFAKAVQLAKQFQFKAQSLSEINNQFELIINCTSLGLKADDPSPVPQELITQQTTISDLIYTPTKLEQICQEQGATYINGYHMLLEQAKLQHKLFTS